jgi:hypothetical protein
MAVAGATRFAAEVMDDILVLLAVADVGSSGRSTMPHVIQNTSVFCQANEAALLVVEDDGNIRVLLSKLFFFFFLLFLIVEDDPVSSCLSLLASTLTLRLSMKDFLFMERSANDRAASPIHDDCCCLIADDEEEDVTLSSLILFKRNRLNSIRYCAVIDDGAVMIEKGGHVPAQLEKW